MCLRGAGWPGQGSATSSLWWTGSKVFKCPESESRLSVDDLKVRNETVLSSQECYNIPVIPEFRRLSWEGWEFKFSLSYIERPYLEKLKDTSHVYTSYTFSLFDFLCISTHEESVHKPFTDHYAFGDKNSWWMYTLNLCLLLVLNCPEMLPKRWFDS